MELQIEVLRRKNAEAEPYWQTIPFSTELESATVATALTAINETPDTLDSAGARVEPIRWECSCLQKKCGACAMRINGTPRLACDAHLREFARAGTVRLEPLRKFPVVADLVVDRSVMFENLKTLRLWFESETRISEAAEELAYDASRCLQCGCCLEVCPNFYPGGEFKGTAAAMPASRLLTALPEAQKKELHRAYRRQFYEGCGKSLACRDICPAGIDVDRLLVNSNAAAVWKRPWKKGK